MAVQKSFKKKNYKIRISDKKKLNKSFKNRFLRLCNQCSKSVLKKRYHIVIPVSRGNACFTCIYFNVRNNKNF